MIATVIAGAYPDSIIGLAVQAVSKLSGANCFSIHTVFESQAISRDQSIHDAL